MFGAIATILRNQLCKSWELNLRTGTGWRAFFIHTFGPLGPYNFPGKSSNTIRTGDFSPMKNFGGNLVLVREFVLPERRIPEISFAFELRKFRVVQHSRSVVSAATNYIKSFLGIHVLVVS